MLQDQPIGEVQTDMGHVVGKELLPPDPSVFGLKVLFPMSSVVTSVVSDIEPPPKVKMIKKKTIMCFLNIVF